MTKNKKQILQTLWAIFLILFGVVAITLLFLALN